MRPAEGELIGVPSMGEEGILGEEADDAGVLLL